MDEGVLDEGVNALVTYVSAAFITFSRPRR